MVNNTLTKLDLTNNDFKEAKHLSDALLVNTTLCILILNGFDDKLKEMSKQNVSNR